jgi:hypothetical protein
LVDFFSCANRTTFSGVPRGTASIGSCGVISTAALAWRARLPKAMGPMTEISINVQQSAATHRDRPPVRFLVRIERLSCRPRDAGTVNLGSYLVRENGCDAGNRHSW